MDPLAQMEALFNAAANVATEAFMKFAFVAACVSISVIGGIAILARRKRG